MHTIRATRCPPAECPASRIGPLMPGEYRLRVVGEPWMSAEETRANAGDEDLVLRLGATSRPTGRIVGTIVSGESREPVPAYARLVDVDDAAAFRDPWTTSATFHWTELPAGTYDLHAWTEDGRAGILRGVTLEDGQTLLGLEVPVAAGGMLRLGYDGPWATVDFEVLHDGRSVGETRNFGLEETPLVLPPGTVRVRATIRDSILDPPYLELEPRVLELHAGDDVRVEFSAEDLPR